MKVRFATVVFTCSAAVWAGALWRAMPVEGAGGDQPVGVSPGWNKPAAAHYLDAREIWWQGWQPAQKDQGTVCISCHTTVPYAMARPALSEMLHQTSAPAAEVRLRESVEARVEGWAGMTPFYSDAADGPGKTAQSHATEVVLNAVILASYDQRRAELRPVTETALDEAWALQQPAGGWVWQDFHLAPWESGDSAYQGAALLWKALDGRSSRYTRQPAVREHEELLRGYLRRGYGAQPMLNQVHVLWAAGGDPGLLGTGERATLMEKLRGSQQADGGWRLCSLAACGEASRPELMDSDGYATALVVLAMRGVAGGEAAQERGLAWLRSHQRAEGDWRATSMNKARVPESNIGRFMSDAATAYAVLALEGATTPAPDAADGKAAREAAGGR